MKRIYNPETKDYDVVPSEGYGPNRVLIVDTDGNPRWSDGLSRLSEEIETLKESGGVTEGVAYELIIQGTAPAAVATEIDYTTFKYTPNMSFEKAVELFKAGMLNEGKIVLTTQGESEDGGVLMKRQIYYFELGVYGTDIPINGTLDSAFMIDISNFGAIPFNKPWQWVKSTNAIEPLPDQ